MGREVEVEEGGEALGEEEGWWARRHGGRCVGDGGRLGRSEEGLVDQQGQQIKSHTMGEKASRLKFMVGCMVQSNCATAVYLCRAGLACAPWYSVHEEIRL